MKTDSQRDSRRGEDSARVRLMAKVFSRGHIHLEGFMAMAMAMATYQIFSQPAASRQRLCPQKCGKRLAKEATKQRKS